MRAGAYAKSLRSRVPEGEHVIAWQRRQPVLHFPANLDFEIAEPVTIPGNVSIVMESPVVVTAAADALPSDFGDYDAWIDIGEDVPVYNRGSRWCRFEMSVIREIQSDWSSLDDLGVRFQNIQSSDIRLNRILGFARAVEFHPGAFCIAFNHVTIGDLRGAKRHLTLNAGPGAAPFNHQFVNHNQFYGGELANGGGEGNGTSQIIGIWLKGGNTETYNNNYFYNQSYEFTTSGEALAVWVEGQASNCSWLAQRTESLDVGMRVSHAESTGCFFDDSYFPFDHSQFTGSALLFDDDSRAQANRQASPWKPLYDNLIPVWDSGMIAKRSNQYNGSTAYAAGGFDISDSVFTMSAGADLIDVSGDVLRHQAGRDLVRWIDTSVNKRFVFFVDTGDPAKPWSPRFRAYDSSGSLLVPVETPASSGIFLPSYVNAITSTFFAWNAGLYSSGAYVGSSGVASYHLFVSFHSSVAKVAFILAGVGTISGGTAQREKSVRIMAVDSPSSSWIETRAPFDNGEYIGTAAPTSGAWKRGTRVYNIAPSAGGTEGWICTAAGTPGTWKTFGAVTA